MPPALVSILQLKCSAKVGISLHIVCQVSSYRGQLLITQGSHSSRFYNFQNRTLVRPDMRLDGK